MVQRIHTRRNGSLRASLAVSIVAAFLFLVGMTPARAFATSGDWTYCWGATLGYHGYCQSSVWNPHLTQLYGVGNEHSVCIGAVDWLPVKCSGGPGQGVLDDFYYTGWWPNSPGYPWIQNQAAGSTVVYGHAYWANP